MVCDLRYRLTIECYLDKNSLEIAMPNKESMSACYFHKNIDREKPTSTRVNGSRISILVNFRYLSAICIDNDNNKIIISVIRIDNRK
jgi:hypothetical protein